MFDRIRGPFGISVIAIAVCAVALAVQMPDLVRSILTGRVEASSRDEIVARVATHHETSITSFSDRVNGRSVFFEPRRRPPPRPPAPPRDPIEDDDPEPIDTGPKRAPAAYSGPSIIAVIGESVWFFDGTYLSVGKEQDGVKVLETNPPRYARIEHTKAGHEPGEYTVPIYDNLEWDVGRLFAMGSSDEGVPGIVEVEDDTEDETADELDAADDPEGVISDAERDKAEAEGEEIESRQGEWHRNPGEDETESRGTEDDDARERPRRAVPSERGGS